tara:strand:+ start:2483 stop:2728 length:246 start_codon:yes stop_codon:yes gene_type:complete
MLSSKEKAKIEGEARDILKKFGKSLEKVKVGDGKKKTTGENSGFRKEGKIVGCDDEFRKRMFENAPKKKGDFLIAEKASWK